MNEALLNEIKKKYEVGVHLLFAMMPYLEDAAKDINSKELKQPPTDEELKSYVDSISPLELAALIVLRCPVKKTVKFGTIDPITGKTRPLSEVNEFGMYLDDTPPIAQKPPPRSLSDERQQRWEEYKRNKDMH